MGRIAVLGAGFSHNWGAPLAEEVMGDVLGRIAHDHCLSSLVGRLPKFEDALAAVQRQFESGICRNSLLQGLGSLGAEELRRGGRSAATGFFANSVNTWLIRD